MKIAISEKRIAKLGKKGKMRVKMHVPAKECKHFNTMAPPTGN